ncbi:F-box domain-containing protein [Mycena kentingensis (nom. inval.)]|nr:F-box domain-containing protein [Mycena kentingensis (nom. inval.)]
MAPPPTVFAEDGVRRQARLEAALIRVSDLEDRLRQNRAFDGFDRIPADTRSSIQEVLGRMRRDVAILREDGVTLADFLAAPVRRLPDDVLCEIFAIFLEESNRYAYGSSHLRLGVGTRWVLTQVCVAWRRAATHFAPLWTQFAVKPCLEESSFHLLQLYLAWSKRAPLSVELGRGDRLTGRIAKCLFDDNGDRITTLLFLSLTADLGLPFPTATLWPRVPNLQLLGIPRLDHDFLVSLAGLRAPELMVERLDGPRISNTHVAALTHTTKLTVHGLNTRRFDDFPALADFTFRDDLADSMMTRGIAGPTPVQLNCLRRLTLHLIPSNGSSANAYRQGVLFDIFTLPHLEYLYIECLRQTGNLPGLLGRSAPNLRSLTLVDANMGSADLLAILRAANSVVDFTFHAGRPHSVTDKVLEELMLSIDGRWAVLPSLRKVDLRGWYMISNEVLVQMLEARSARGLKNVRLVLPVSQSFTPVHRKRLEALTATQIVFVFN